MICQHAIFSTLARRRLSVRLMCLLCAVISPVTAVAQSGPDTLIVVDAGGQLVPFANVFIGGATAQVTNANGLLIFRSNSDTLNLSARRIG